MLLKARNLLGPRSVPGLQPYEQADGELLGKHLDGVLALLHSRLPHEGPKALEIARFAFEVADLERQLRGRAVQRRLRGLSTVQSALADLRAIGSVDLMLERSTEVVCRRCGFDRAVLFRIEDNVAVAASAFDRRDLRWAEKVRHFVGVVHRPVLDHLLLESEMLHSGAAAIVRDAKRDPRTFKPLIELSNVDSYVAAPIMPEGPVIGFLHADTRYQDRDVDLVDRDVLWAFAEGYGYALERTLLQEKVRSQRDEIRQMLRSADLLITKLGDAAVQLVRADTATAMTSSSRLAHLGTRVHELLTRREIEVMERVLRGESNKRIADRLSVSEATIKSHIGNIFTKLHVVNRAEAVHSYMSLISLLQP